MAADRNSRKTRYRIAVLASGRTPTQIAASVGYSERHLDTAVTGDRPLPQRLAEALGRELGPEAFRFVLGECALIVPPTLGGGEERSEA